jgi:hypothetical protein
MAEPEEVEEPSKKTRIQEREEEMDQDESEAMERA